VYKILTNNNKILSIVVPCFNEEQVLPETIKELSNILIELIGNNKISSRSKILFVDDGSKDNTWMIIEQHSDMNSHIQGIKFSRNFGHQSALVAGMETARKISDCVITIDADLQDDVNAIYEFIEKYREGYDIVYGVRDKRDTDTFFKKHTALFFYKMMEKMGVKLIPNHADYRLMSKRALDELSKYKEENLFLRGIIPLLGFKSTNVYYDRKERFAGESKYPLKKMLGFALDGITSFSIVPIRMVTYLGTCIAGLGFFFGIYALIQHFLGHVTSGWTSLILSMWIIGGIQLIAIGIIGEYIGKIFKESKHRPRYTIEKDTIKENKIETVTISR
jgi:glycosyltransferase involved in cell wall biosynthesis